MTLVALRTLQLPRRRIEGALSTWRRSLSTGNRFSVRRVAAMLSIVLIAIPVALASVYYSLIASPQYVSRAKFAVRTTVERTELDAAVEEETEEETSSALGGGGSVAPIDGLPGGAGFSYSVQNPFIAASFIMSRDFVASLNEGGWLASTYSADFIDPLSRLPADASLEELFRHWRRHAVAAVDRRANTVLLEVSAYTAEGAREIARRALSVIEEMLNGMTMRQRRDTLAVARAELARAQARHEAIVMQLREMRREQTVVDPVGDAEKLAASLYRLMSERIDLVAERETLRGTAGPEAMGIDGLTVRIEALEGEIEGLQGRLVGGEGANDTAVKAIAALEEIEVERQFAETMLNIASTTYDTAARAAERQLSFLLVFVEPPLPEEPSKPDPLIAIGFVAGLGFLAWLFTVTAVAVVSDQTS